MRSVVCLILFIIGLFWIKDYSAASDIIELDGLNTQKSWTYPFQTNKPLVIIFMSKDCPCSKSYMNYINDLIEKYDDYSFIGIHAMKNKNRNDLEFYLNSKEFKESKLEIYNDPELKLTDTLKAVKTPHAFILKSNKIIYSGGITNSMMPQNAKNHYLINALDEYRKNQNITISQTKALGCYILR